MYCSTRHNSYYLELLAIQSVLSWILWCSTQHVAIVILSDCLSALEDINNPNAVHSREKIEEILNISHQTKLRGTDIVIAWIPALVGIPGNEEAGRLA